MEEDPTEYKIRVMQAFLDGEKVQCRRLMSSKPWCPAGPCPSWAWADYDYRIKPEPRAVYVNEYADGDFSYAYPSAELARQNAAMPRRIAVKYQEVQE